MRGDTGRIWIGEVEFAQSLLATGVSRPRHQDDPSGRLLVRLHGHVLAFVSVPLRTGGADATAVVDAAVRSQLGPTLREHPAAERLPEGARRTSRMWRPTAIGGRAPASFVVAEARHDGGTTGLRARTEAAATGSSSHGGLPAACSGYLP